MLDTDVELAEAAADWLVTLGAAASSDDLDAFADHFLPDGWLRDLLCYSWDFRTLSGRDTIYNYLAAPASDKYSTNGFTSDAAPSPKSPHGRRRFDATAIHALELDINSTLDGPTAFPLPADPSQSGVQAAFTFSLREPHARGRGFFRLVPTPRAGWKALTVFLSLHELIGYEEPVARPLGIPEDPATVAAWEDEYVKEGEAIEKDPTVLIVGAGQAGLMCAARFRRMGIRTLVVEKTPRVGDVWRQRDRETFPKYVDRTRLANFMESYAILQDLHIWTSTTVLSSPEPRYDSNTQRWTVTVSRNGGTFEIKPKHLVLALGSGQPTTPTWPGMDTFEGNTYHSDYHRNAGKWRGKKAIVVGSCNAGADIAQDFASNGVDVTIVQRTPTCVMSYKTADKLTFDPIWNKSRASEDADLFGNSMPNRLVIQSLANGGLDQFKKLDAELHVGLEAKGYKLTWSLNGVEAGYPVFLLEQLARGTMMDIGVGQLIIDGKVKVKHGVDIVGFESDCVVFADGTKLPADVVALATGNAPAIETIRSLVGAHLVSKIGGKVWGLDPDGEHRRLFRPTGQPGLWIVGGGISTPRYHSRHLGLQILAEELGIKGPTPGYSG
ncbi:FAD/NAD(P)-binding domain-containing protein [Coniophora puteana RWD-64-598 SS2]|uniref:FAD/NAD(P)-binding domain-containing protein n=1 Tax=Coniophora puteana (strain RWD-64-598) TaxID=741705 RepID=A0A5M3M9C4_CONPW|nr:FAD/NAD(P)-binding domain-containing protein [Coniophora puteana RWD-64-598 SS2]EIW75295.1 FAD/NAD(P)-binding domain-containing protein [Coniophora puteana RWD-64-598 SS2]